MICATPRTGTNLLCEALAKTGVAGRPDEYFGHMHVQRWKKKWQAESAVDYIQSLKNEAQTENGIWGVKVMMQYYDDLYSLLSDAHEDKTIGRFDIVERTFSELNYVWMTRRDKIAQAISLHKAYQDFVWTVDKGDIPLMIRSWFLISKRLIEFSLRSRGMKLNGKNISNLSVGDHLVSSTKISLRIMRLQ